MGLPLFANGRNGILIEIHYNNPDLIEGLKDSSGLKFYYTNQDKKHEAGILSVGDPLLGLNEESVGQGLTQYSFSCPSACSETFLGPDHVGYDKGVTVIFESKFKQCYATIVCCTNHFIILLDSLLAQCFICIRQGLE